MKRFLPLRIAEFSFDNLPGKLISNLPSARREMVPQVSNPIHQLRPQPCLIHATVRANETLEEEKVTDEKLTELSGDINVEGLSSLWDESVTPYWKNKSPETEQKVRDLLKFETTKFQSTKGYVDPKRISPDRYTFDQLTLDRPGNDVLQLALFYDYQNNVKQYSHWHEALCKYKPISARSLRKE